MAVGNSQEFFHFKVNYCKANPIRFGWKSKCNTNSQKKQILLTQEASL